MMTAFNEKQLNAAFALNGILRRRETPVSQWCARYPDILEVYQRSSTDEKAAVKVRKKVRLNGRKQHSKLELPIVAYKAHMRLIWVMLENAFDLFDIFLKGFCLARLWPGFSWRALWICERSGCQRLLVTSKRNAKIRKKIASLIKNLVWESRSRISFRNLGFKLWISKIEINGVRSERCSFAGIAATASEFTAEAVWTV